MKWILLVLSCVICVELAIKSGLVKSANDLVRILKKSLQTLASSKISDHWKEKALPRYSIQIIASSLRLFIIMFLCLSPFLIAVYLSNRMFWNFETLLYQPLGLIGSTVLTIAYALARNAGK